MENSIIKYLGKFWGGLTIFLPTIFLVKPEVLIQLRHLVEENIEFSIMYALLSLVIGMATIVFHNKWVWKWNVIITIFGWLCIVKAFMVLCFNNLKKEAIPSFDDRVIVTQLLLFLVLILGVWIYYKVSTVKIEK